MGQPPFPGPGDSGFGPPPPPPFPPPPPRRLFRRQDDRVLAGVCSGIATYLGTDPAAIRIAFVLGAFFGGFGLLAYVVLWIAMPAAGYGASWNPGGSPR
ncbi:MAG TPA: PspC domain-containing protein [Candidatus Binatia bacterium]|nr:PspC domain-containing protein [Candidatus Binatia bacterium]